MFVEPTVTTERRFGSALYITQKALTKLVERHSFSYRPYQATHAAIYAVQTHNIMSGEMGLGKTVITALTLIATYPNLKQMRPGAIQIAAPSKLSARARWRQDLSQFEELSQYIEVISSPSQIQESTKPIWVYDLDFPKRVYNREKGKVITYLKRRYKPSYLVIDEIQKVRKGTQRYKALFTLARKARRVLALSGTLSNGSLDTQEDTLSLVYNNPELRKLREKYGVKTKIQTNYLGGLESGPKATSDRFLGFLSPLKMSDYYWDVFRPYIHRFELTDPDVSSVVTKPSQCLADVGVPLGPAQQDYRQLITKEIQTLIDYGTSKDAVKAFSLIQPLIRFCNLGPKLDYLIPAITGNKVAVFIDSVSAADQVEQDLVKHFSPSQVVRLHAKLTMDKRYEVLDNFQYNSEVKVGIFSLRLTAESLDLNEADQVIFYEQPWCPMVYAQAIDRVVRPGNPNDTVVITNLYTEGTVEEHRHRLLNLKVNAMVGANRASIDPLECLRNASLYQTHSEPNL